MHYFATIQYFFDGRLRWSGPWASPNQLAAFLAMVLPFIWAFRSSGPRWWSAKGVFLIEGVLYYILIRSYSRSGMLAACAAAAASLACILAERIEERGYLRIRIADLAPVAFRIAVFCALLLSSGMEKRVGVDFIREDASIANRWSTMENSLRMIADRPFTGWGLYSATTYVNWYQPLDRDINLGNLLSGNIQAAVELGLASFGCLLATIFWCIACPFLFRRSKPAMSWQGFGGRWHHLSAATSSACVAFVTANTFCVHTAAPSLFIFFISCAIFLVFVRVVILRSVIKRMMLAAAVATLVICGALILLGWRAQSLATETVVVTRNEVTITPAGKESPLEVIEVWPDKEVLGEYYGKSVRALMPSLGKRYSLRVRLSTLASLQSEDTRSIYFGRSCGQLPPTRKIRSVLVHPITANEALSVPFGTVFMLPEFDEIGQNEYWNGQAHATGGTVFISRGVGLDLRPTLRETAVLLATAITDEKP